MVVSLPQSKVSALQGQALYDPIIDAIQLLARSNCVALYFVALGDNSILERYEVGDGKHYEVMKNFDGRYLLDTKKYLWEEGKFSFVRSPEDVRGVAAFIVFHKMKNRLEETGVFQILAAEALFIFSMNSQASLGSVEPSV